MDYVKLVLFFILFSFLCQLAFCSSLSHLCPKEQALSLLQFKNMFTLPLTQLYGVLPKRVFHLSSLESLDLSYNPQLTVKFPTTKWNSSASLMELYLSGVNATGTIPESFGHLASLRTLHIAYCNLSGSVPKPLWNLTNIEELNLDYNHLEGPISDLFRFGKLSRLSLGNNNLDGQLEFLSFNRSLTQLQFLDFSFNSLTGPIPSNFKSKTLSRVSLKQNQLQGPIPKSLLNQRDLHYLLFSHNNLSGQIASTICNLKTLRVLDLGSNNLEGTIPLCLGEMSGLWALDLSNNSLSGIINTTLSVGNDLRIIKFDGNKLEGKVPQSLINCKYLEVVDLGNNELNDTFPKWLGALPELQILNLRSNKFYGPIKDSRTDKLFAQIRVIDLSSNGFSGDLPMSLFEKFEAMKITSENRGTRDGEIPQQLASLTSLEVLNLSHNYLVGCIPKGKQFDTFENSSYQGNDGLRGLPLSKDCGGDEGVPQATTQVGLDEGEEGDSAIISWQAVLMGYGCGLVVGLSIIYIMLSTQYPAWFSRMDVELEHKILTRMKKQKKRH
ncbi:hypothetical protein MTR67_000460 [Solanum verrucosum]|uniref:Uncharacterized protein n=1 Tax=Solanum verrucosum TaxID=315347 RepID=A0AAF0TBJ7_SOLVR|nr:hypothetical protein MTR67_000460 [Solanum verrucosum]